MKILINDNSFSYDVYSLTKAFFPSEEIKTGFWENKTDGIKTPGNFTISFDNGNITTLSVPYGNESRRQYKNKIKREVYITLSRMTGKTLPWGTLTGIRPTKLPMAMICEGKADSEIRDYLRSEYFISDEKISLAVSIAKKEVSVMDKLNVTDGISIYIGIPFCPSTCMYCSFTSYPISKWEDKTDEYLLCIKKEIDYVKDAFSSKVIDTVYIGGGTPTTLSEKQLLWLLTYLSENLNLTNLKELTVEAGRPDSITENKLKVLKDCGVSRISVNPQTLNEDTLRLIGRAHNVKQFYEAFEISKKYFDNINTDLILGLPGEDDKKVAHTFDEIKKLKPQSITVHSMAIKRAANMDEYLKNHPDVHSSITDEMMRNVYETAQSLKMDPYYLYRQKNMTGNYENTGFSIKNCEGIYNILIMEEVQSIVALGAGSISKRIYPNGRIERCDNVKDVKLYMEKIDEMIERKRNLF